MLITIKVTSELSAYEVELDDSALVDNPAEYRVAILAIIPEDPVAFKFTKLVNKDFIINLSYEPDIEWTSHHDEQHDEMMAEIGRAYLTEIGY